MSEVTEVVATPAEVSSSLSAGFNKVRGEPPTESLPAKTEPIEAKQEAAATEEVKAEPEVKEEAKADDPPKEEPIAGFGLTPSELRAQLAGITELRAQLETSERKLQGKMGSLKSELLDIVKSAKTETPATVAKVTRDKLKRVAAEYGDDMANALAEDLNDLIAAPAGTVDAEQMKAQFQETLNTRLAEEKLQNEVRMFTRAHPDWKELQGTDNFKVWQNTLPPETRVELGKSRDADFLIDQFTNFKNWQKAADPTANKQKNAARLEGGQVPQGTPSHSPSALPDKAGLSAGFNKVRKLG